MLESLFNKVQGMQLYEEKKTPTNNMCFSFCIDISGKHGYKRKNVTPIKRARASS